MENVSVRAQSAIQRTPHASPTPIQDMCVNHRCAHIFVTQEFLHRANVLAIFYVGKTITEVEWLISYACQHPELYCSRLRVFSDGSGRRV